MNTVIFLFTFALTSYPIVLVPVVLLLYISLKYRSCGTQGAYIGTYIYSTYDTVVELGSMVELYLALTILNLGCTALYYYGWPFNWINLNLI